jgi:hypothetical protein
MFANRSKVSAMAMVLIMVLLNFSPLITSAGSVWREDGKSFAKGALDKLQLFNGDMWPNH